MAGIDRRHHQLFIADLHLQASEPASLALATQFVSRAQGVGAVWILGDLFEHWIGDDDTVAWAQPFIDALTVLSEGSMVNLMHGNRDFLLGRRFAASVGATLHPQDDVIIELGSDTVLLMHGDTLCTDDTDYQQLRTTLRSSEWQADFLTRPLPERRQFAQALRSTSAEASAQKDGAITDANPAAVMAAMQAAGASTLIHGHTHRPQEHAVTDLPGRRVVVGDWHPDGAQVAHWNGTDLVLKPVRPTASGGTPFPSGELSPFPPA